MAPRRYKLTPEVQRTIVAFIRAGSFPHIAAVAAGIPSEVFNEWMARGCPMRRGPNWKPHKLYTPLWEEVRQAEAQARVGAEVEARNGGALRWLLQGPGKDRPDVPGWSQTVRPQPARGDAGPLTLEDPRVQELFAGVLQALEPFPDAHAAVNRALAGVGRASGEKRSQPPLQER